MTPMINYTINSANGQPLELAPYATSQLIDNKSFIGNMHHQHQHFHIHHQQQPQLQLQQSQLQQPHTQVQIQQQQRDNMSLNARLKHYQSYLDDHEQLRHKQLKSSAKRKYGLIMRSIRNKSRDLFQFEYHDEDEDEADEDEIDDFDDDLMLDGHRTPFDALTSFGPASVKSSSGTLAFRRRRSDSPNWNNLIRKHQVRITNEMATYNQHIGNYNYHQHLNQNHQQQPLQQQLTWGTISNVVPSTTHQHCPTSYHIATIPAGSVPNIFFDRRSAPPH